MPGFNLNHLNYFNQKFDILNTTRLSQASAPITSLAKLMPDKLAFSNATWANGSGSFSIQTAASATYKFVFDDAAISLTCDSTKMYNGDTITPSAATQYQISVTSSIITSVSDMTDKIIIFKEPDVLYRVSDITPYETRMKAIEDRLNTSWVYPTMTSTFVNTSIANDNLKYRKEEGTVFIQGEVQVTSTQSPGSGYITLFTLPEGYRPAINLYYLCPATGLLLYLLNITTAGLVRVGRFGRHEYMSIEPSYVLYVAIDVPV